MQAGANTEVIVEEPEGRSRKEFICRQYEVEISDSQYPIIYCQEYDIGFAGIEKLHPADSRKWGHIVKLLKDAGMLTDEMIVKPMEVSREELLTVHTARYLSSLSWSFTVARIAEVPILICLPNFLIQRYVLRPFRYQTSGTIMAGKLALERGWAINIGGGFHHCSHDKGGGFCTYADITLAVKFAFKAGISKVMIIDLDAHQGNGYQRDFMQESRVYILDVYNRDIYPNDTQAKKAIRRKVELNSFTSDSKYLKLVSKHFGEALTEFEPELVVYNAGTDVLIHDPLGNLSISPQGVVERDQIVFSKCRLRKKPIPVFMLTSGGYTPESASVVAASIINLKEKDLISLGLMPRKQSTSSIS